LEWDAVHAIRDVVKRHDIQVIHCHGIKPVLYTLLAGRHGAALISTCHLWTFDSGKEWTLSAVERCMLHGFDRVVAVSDQITPQLRRFGLKADVIYNGIETMPIAGPVPGFREKMNWSGRLVVAAIARLAKQKGLQYLLQAAPEVLQEVPDALFVFVGEGPERPALEAEAKSLGIQDSVRFLGTRNDISDILASVDVLAMPSLSEGMPMALLEAMASGKAVAASGVGGIPHVIQDRVNGILLVPEDVNGLAAALKELLKSSDLRNYLGQNAMETVESKFSAASMATRYMEVYSEAATSMR
jgi:glycosyltransferase involved in cell wall biosynthesis